MAKKIRIYYEKSQGEFSSGDYPVSSLLEVQGLVNRFELENGVKVIDVAYFPQWYRNITGGIRIGINLSLFRDE